MGGNRPAYDEGDTIFSRMGELPEGSEKYEAYYGEHPEREEVDRELRNAGPGQFAGHLFEQTQADGIFRFLKDIRPLTHGIVSSRKVDISPEEASVRLKETLSRLGCVTSGICLMEESFFYSRRGRGSRYGQIVDPSSRPYGIIFAVELDGESLMKAPGPAEMTEVAGGYARAALAGMAVSYWIREMGYDAVCHMDGESEIVLPPAAEKAGLGEIGRMGLLINQTYGARIRLGAVTTDLALKTDEPQSFGLKEFCRKCGKCARFCAAHAIGEGDGRNGVNHEACYAMWKKLATDCGVCLASCPFSVKGVKSPGKGVNIKQFMYEQGEKIE